MKIYLNESSPFARLVLAVAIELGVKDIDLEWTDPWSCPKDLLAVNPFSTIPVLVLDDGTSLQESLFISRYLMDNAGRHGQNSSPMVDKTDAGALARGSTGKSLMEVAFRRVVLDRFSPEGEGLRDRASDALSRVLSTIRPGEVPSVESKVQFSELCLVIALLYVRFRLREDFDRYVSEEVQSWLRSWERRVSVHKTDPASLASKPSSVSGLVA